METLFVYLIKVNAALVLFYLVYVVLLRKDTFIRLKRHYFLAAIVFSLAYPFFTVAQLGNLISFWQADKVVETRIVVGEPQMTVLLDEATDAKPVPIGKILFWTALAGTLVLSIRIVWQLASIFRIRLRGRKRLSEGIAFYRLSENIAPFSFFRWIFLNPGSHSEAELRQILAHEQTHVRQWHSIDIMLAEWLCAFFWWNPAAWLMRREIAINLEYLADNAVLCTGVSSREYQYHLLRLTYQETGFQMVNKFNVSQLKQRIMMMNRTKSPAAKLAKYLTILPMAILLITANSAYAQSTQPSEPTKYQDNSLQDKKPKKVGQSEEVFSMVDQPPQFNGGVEALFKFLSDNLVYPKAALEKGIQGHVIVNFIVGKDGSIDSVAVVKGIDPSLDKEALRVVSAMPKWIPGKHRGVAARVIYTLPIAFELGQTVVGTTMPLSVAISLQKQPVFPGGKSGYIKYLNETIKYPISEMEKNGQGIVSASYKIDENGNVYDEKIEEGASDALNDAVLSIIKKMPKWETGSNLLVEGKVTDSNAKPLQGASVVVKGSTTGTISDADGNFYLVVQESDNPSLSVSFVGMKSAIVDLTKITPKSVGYEVKLPIVFRLVGDNVEPLTGEIPKDAVVVTAYGMKK
ncbi:MAG: TonB family protein [Dysgonamonadaceae bacterium]|jgi:TonB family protein|nr:TonB family protein [Dysgonamonadaceae bacterium]